MRVLLFSIALVIGIYEGMLFFKFGTFSPCGALSVQVRRIHEQARSELGLPISIPVYLIPGAVEREQQRERQALGIPDSNTPLHCVSALWNISSDYQRSIEMAKNSWQPTEEQRARQ